MFVGSLLHSEGTVNIEQSKTFDKLKRPFFGASYSFIEGRCLFICLFVFRGEESVFIHANAVNFPLFLSGKKRPAWDYKGRLEDMEGLMLKSKSFMEDMTKTIGDNQGRIGYLESLNKQLEGTVQVKHQQTEEVAFLLRLFLLFFFFFSIGKWAHWARAPYFTKRVLKVDGPEITFFSSLNVDHGSDGNIFIHYWLFTIDFKTLVLFADRQSLKLDTPLTVENLELSFPKQ